ncbi:MAG: rubrerythrin family protein [Spirochaetaceae bacterium]|jgi:rubrerythrin|nr:rubrerythrin family protein [Spirochaetaceae bacterium]
MANLKGSKTEKNLQAAFAGESQARNKYFYFASRAKEEGYSRIAQIFEETGKNEYEHAKIWFKYLGGIGSTADNLKAASAGENYEWSDMYVSFANTAREEGFNDVAEHFEQIGAIEKQHEARYLKLLEDMGKQGKGKADNFSAWQCVNCGNVINAKAAPNKCPVCSYADIPWSGTNAYITMEV